MNEPNPTLRYRRHPLMEAAFPDTRPVATNPFWRDVPRVEVTLDTTSQAPHGLRCVAGTVSAEVLARAEAYIRGQRHDTGTVLLLQHNPITGQVEVDEPLEAPALDLRHDATVDLGLLLTAGLGGATTLLELIELVQINATRATELLTELRDGGYGLAMVEDGHAATAYVTELNWPGPDATVITNNLLGMLDP